MCLIIIMQPHNNVRSSPGFKHWTASYNADDLPMCHLQVGDRSSKVWGSFLFFSKVGGWRADEKGSQGKFFIFTKVGGRRADKRDVKTSC